MSNDMASNAFAKTLADLRRGQTLVELSNELADLVQAVKETGKKGEICLKLRLTPSAGGEAVVIEDAVTMKVPKMDRASTTFFTTEDNLLTRQDPRQMEMGLRAVDGGQQNEQEAEPEAAES